MSRRVGRRSLYCRWMCARLASKVRTEIPCSRGWESGTGIVAAYKKCIVTFLFEKTAFARLDGTYRKRDRLCITYCVRVMAGTPLAPNPCTK